MSLVIGRGGFPSLQEEGPFQLSRFRRSLARTNRPFEIPEVDWLMSRRDINRAHWDLVLLLDRARKRLRKLSTIEPIPVNLIVS